MVCFILMKMEISDMKIIRLLNILTLLSALIVSIYINTNYIFISFILTILTINVALLLRVKYTPLNVIIASQVIISIASFSYASITIYNLIFSGAFSNLRETVIAISFSIISYSIIFYCRNNNKDYSYDVENKNHSFYSFLVAMPITLFTLVMVHIYKESYTINISEKLLDRGSIPPITLFLFFWCISDTFSIFCNSKINLLKLKRSRNLNTYNSMITIPIHTRMSIIEEAHYRRFQLPSFINWSIPVLGFIGTVLGISLSSENIQKVISNDESMSNMSKGISEAIAPLGIAFDTTLVALSLGIISTFFTLVSSNSERKYISELQVHLERGEYEKK